MPDKTPNHHLSLMSCPQELEDVDLFSDGAQEHWYEAYEILHREAPVLQIPGEGLGPGSDGFVLTRYEDVSRVVRDPVRYPPTLSLLHLRWGAANVDAEEFECPFELDLDRKAASRHLAFSAGPRVCPGAGISRLEQTIAWNRLLDRISRFEYAEDNDFLHQPGIMLGTLRLNLKFEVRKGTSA
jgi:cytochrome P450